MNWIFHKFCFCFGISSQARDFSFPTCRDANYPSQNFLQHPQTFIKITASRNINRKWQLWLKSRFTKDIGSKSNLRKIDIPVLDFSIIGFFVKFLLFQQPTTDYRCKFSLLQSEVWSFAVTRLVFSTLTEWWIGARCTFNLPQSLCIGWGTLDKVWLIESISMYNAPVISKARR